MLESPECADRVNARDETSEPAQRLVVFELGRAAGPPRIQREAKAAVLAQSGTVGDERRDDRDFAACELERERVLLEDGGVGPALRPVELRDQGRPVFEPCLIDAVLVAVQREEPPVAPKRPRLDCVEDQGRRERVISCHSAQVNTSTRPGSDAADLDSPPRQSKERRLRRKTLVLSSVPVGRQRRPEPNQRAPPNAVTAC